MTIDDLRAAGVPRQKAGYLQAAAAFKQAGQLEHEVLHPLDDETLIHHLTQINGMGRWTVQMLLMFALERPDVFPKLDLGIQNATRRHCGLTETDKALLARITQLAAGWQPYRTVASRLVRKSLDNSPAAAICGMTRSSANTAASSSWRSPRSA